MKQAIYGLVIYIFMMLPPVIELSESNMVIHMHMQMPLLIVVGMLFTPFLKQRFPHFFKKWNSNGVPGILLAVIIFSFWLIPRMMDDAIASPIAEIFKFISLPFLVGVPLRESWRKLTPFIKKILYVTMTILFGAMAWLYIASPAQLCNNYLMSEQKALGWIFLFMGLCVFLYFIQTLFIEDYE